MTDTRNEPGARAMPDVGEPGETEGGGPTSSAFLS